MLLERNKLLTVMKQFIVIIILVPLRASTHNSRSHLSNYEALNYSGMRYEHPETFSVFIKEARTIGHKH
jgi:hypothetical protein